MRDLDDITGTIIEAALWMHRPTLREGLRCIIKWLSALRVSAALREPESPALTTQRD